MCEFLQQFDFVSPEGLWNPTLTGNEIEDYAYGYKCAERYFSRFAKFLNEKGDLSEDEKKRLFSFADSTLGDTPERKGFSAFVVRLESLIEEAKLDYGRP